MPAQGLGVGVETEKNSLVDERIFLLGPGAFLSFLASGSDNRLNFIAIDKTCNVRVGDFSRREAKEYYFRKITEKADIKTHTCNLSCEERLSQRFQILRQEDRKHLESR